MNWSSGELEATNTAIEPERRPARPSCCQVDAMLPGYPTSTAAWRLPTSIPSSSAFVETTAHTSFDRSPASISRRRKGR
jgi:hypothetical protein